jgi:silicon transporter
MNQAFINFQKFYAMLLLIFSVVSVTGLIFTNQTTLAQQTHPAIAFVVLWAAVGWLTMVEGGQGSLVGLAPVNKELFKDSHPLSYKCAALCHKGDNLDRYLLGRQFMVVLIVFCVNISGGPVGGAQLWGYPNWVVNIFFQVGFAMILLTCMIGQLNSQVNGCHCMLDYINNYFALFTLWVAMAIEFSGILHSSYLIQILVSKLSGKAIDSNEPPRDAMQSIFFFGRCLMSLALLCFCIAVTIQALMESKTTIWAGIPMAASLVIFVVLLCVVGMLEGMQIAFFAVAKLQPSERGSSKFALKTCELLFRGKGRNLPGFMIGRQLCVVSCMFFVARITSVQIEEGETNIFGVNNTFQAFLNTGLCGAFIVTIVGSISWQLVASAFPIAFLSNPLCYVFLRCALLLEATGLCSGAWVLASIHKKIAGFKRDEVYIGTAEERAAKSMQDKEMGTGHMLKLPVFAEMAPPALRKLMENDPAVMEFIASLHDDKAADIENA